MNVRTLLYRSVVAAVLSVVACPLFAAVYTASTSGDFATFANWTPMPSVPFTAADDIIIPGGFAMTVNSTQTVKSITFTAAGGASSITIGTGAILNVDGVNGNSFAIEFADPNINIREIVASSGGTLAADGTVSLFGSSSGGVSKLKSTGGTLDTGGLSFGGTQTNNAIVDLTGGSGTGTYRTSGSLGTGGSYNAGSASTTEFYGTSVQNIPAYNYHHLKINKSLGNALPGSSTLSIGGDLNLFSGTLATNSSHTVTIAGQMFGSGTLDMTSGGEIRLADNNNHTGTFTAGTGTFKYNGGTGQTVRGTTYNNLAFITTNTNGLLAGNVVCNGFLMDPSTFLTLSSNTLAISGNATINGSINSPGTVSFTSGTGTTIAGTGSINATITSLSTRTISTGSNLAISGSVTIAASSTVTNQGTVDIGVSLEGTDPLSQWTQDTNSSLTIGGTAFSLNGVLFASASPNTVSYDSGNQTIYNTTYHHLTLTTGVPASKTINASPLVINGNLTLSNQTTFTLGADTTIGGNVNIGSLSQMNAGAFNIAVGGNWSRTGTFVAGTSSLNFNGSAPQNIDGGPFYNIAFNASGAKTITTSALDVSNDFTINGPTVNAGNFVHQVGGDWTNSSGTFNPGTGEVVFDPAASVSLIGDTTFHKMTVAGGGFGDLNLGANVTVNNNFSLTGGSFTTAGFTIDVLGNTNIGPGTFCTIGSTGTFKFRGDLVSDGSLVGSGGTLEATGTAIQNWSGSTAPSLSNLWVNKSGGGSLNPTMLVNVNGTFTLDGVVATSGNIIAFASSASIIRTSGYVDGRVSHTFPGTSVYPLGSASGYAPVTIQSLGAGTLDIEIFNTPQPNNTSGGADLLQIYWRIYSGTLTGNADLTFAWPAGVVNGTEANFVFGRYNTGWSRPSGGSYSTNTALINGQAFYIGDWTLGEPASLGAATTFDLSGSGTTTAGSGVLLTITAKDALGNTDTSYTGAHSLTFAGFNPAPDGTQPTASDNTTVDVNFGINTIVQFTAGIGSTTLKLYADETGFLDVSESGGPSTTTQLQIVVSAAAAQELRFLNVNNSNPVYANAPFTATVQSIDQYENAAPVVANTIVDITQDNCVECTGTLTPASETIFAGQSQATVAGLSYTAPDSGYVLDATRSSGDILTSATSASFVINAQVAGIVVTTSADSGAGSLREAMTRANSGECALPCAITFNIAPSGAHEITLATPLPLITMAMDIDGSTQPGYTGLPVIALNGGSTGSDGFHIGASPVSIDSIIIHGFGSGYAVHVENTDGATIQNCWIGLNLTGTGASANAYGIVFTDSDNNIVDGNVLSGNTGAGILMEATSSGNTLTNNIIGLNAAGTGAVPNAYGVKIVDDASTNTVGGSTIAARNVISGNTNAGVYLEGDGIVGSSVQSQSIDDPRAMPFSGNVNANVIKNNYIGTNANGDAAAGNGTGVHIVTMATANMIGGTGDGNVISGNGTAIDVDGGDDTTIRGNLIGLAGDGLTALANSAGIVIGNATDTRIGGTGGGDGNTIANHTTDGIIVNSGTGTEILGNTLRDNGPLGIDLNDDGPDGDDNAANDADGGANGTQNYPLITLAEIVGANVQITANMSSSATSANSLRVEFFEVDTQASGEGMILVGSSCVGFNNFGTTFTYPVGSIGAGDRIVATATSYTDGGCGLLGDGTSEFSPVFQVTACTPPAATITPSGPTSFCTPGSVTLTASAGTSWLWSNGATTQSILVSASGTFTVQVFNASGCSATSAPVTVTATTAPSATITPSGPTTFCSGGSVTLTASAGTSWLWSNGATTQSILVNSSGSFSVQVFNGSCGNTSAPTTVTVNTPSPATITPSGPTTFCTPGSVTLTASAGNSWLWSNGATTQSIIVSASGTFSVTVTDVNGCQSTSGATTVTVTTTPTATITPSGPTTFCAGGSVTLTASAGTSWLWSNGATTQSIPVTTSGTFTVQVFNGTCGATSAPATVTVNTPSPATITPSGPTTFCTPGSVTLTASAGTSWLWSNGATTQSIIVSASGTFSVTVTDSNGCQSTSGTTTVTTTATPTATITPSGPTTFCAGGSVTLTASNGTSWLWSNGATTQSILVNAAGSYTVQVFNGSCSATSAPTPVVVNTPSPATITPSGPTTFCTPGSVTLTASAGTSWLWSNGATTQSIIVSTSGTFSVTVTDSNGCQSTSGATTVTATATPTATITPSGPTTFCAPGSVTLTASAGTSWLWSNGATTQSILVNASGSYSVQVFNGSCGATSAPTTVTVNTPSPASITPSGPTTFCAPGSVTLTASNGVSWLWSNGATTQSILVNASGTFTVTVTDGNGCQATSSPTAVTVNTAAPATITPSGPTTFCTGGSVTLTASAGTSWLWSNGATTQSILVNASGTFSVTVTDGNGCQSTSPSTTVTVNPGPAATITPSGPTTFCAGGSVILTASNGNAWLWSNGASTQSITVNASGTFTVQVADAGGCINTSAPATVTVNPAATPVITGPTSTCTGTPVTLNAGAYTSYLWSNGATTPSITVTPTGTTTYSVTVTDGNGCSGSDTHVVTVASNPVATINAPAAVCANSTGNTASVAVQAGATYNWTIGGGTITAGLGTDTITFTAGPSGTVTLNVSVVLGSCTSNGNVNVPITSITPVVITGPASACPGVPFQLDAGAGYTSYLWSNGATTQQITVSQSVVTTYSVTVGNGACSSTDSHTVTIAASPNANITAPSSVDPNTGGHNASVPNQAGATYLWSIANGSITSGQGTRSITFSSGAAGNISLGVTVTNNGCTATGTDTVGIGSTAQADLSISKSGPSTVVAGGSLVYTIHVANAGPDIVSDLNVIDTFPTGTTFVSASGSGWVCSPSPSNVLCVTTSPLIGAASPITLTLTAPSQPGTISNIVVVQSSIDDPNSGNNSANVLTTVTPQSTECPGDLNLVSPAAFANVTSPVTFSWSFDGPPTTQYELWIETNGVESLAGTTSATSLTVPLPSGASTWWVIALPGGNCTFRDSERRVVNVTDSGNCASHGKPQLIAPSTGSLLTSPVTFNWTAVPQAIGYRLWIEVDGGGAQDIGTTDGAISFSAEVPPGAIAAYVDALFSGCPPTRSDTVRFSVMAPEPCANRGTATPLSPAAGSVLNSSNVTFQWLAAANAGGYRIWVIEGTGVPHVVGETGLTSLAVTLGSGPMTWWVESLFEGCASTESSRLSFSITPAQQCGTTRPELIAPAAGTNVFSNNVTFSWTAVPNAVAYELYLAHNNGTPALAATVAAPATSVQHEVPPGILEWFVRARIDRCPSLDSPARRFTYTQPAACEGNDRGITVSPSDKSHVSSPVTFVFSAPPAATKWEVYVAKGNQQPELVATGSNLGVASGIDLPNGQARWFVRHFFNGCPALDSAEAQFVVVPKPAACATLEPPVLFAPGQISSGAGFFLNWTTVPGATSYQLELADTPTFANSQFVPFDRPQYFTSRRNDGTEPVAFFARVRALDSRCTPASVSAFSPTTGIFVLPERGTEIAALAAEWQFIEITIPLGAELAGQPFTATPTQPWLTVTPSNGTVPPGGMNLLVKANSASVPLGTSLGGVTITLGSAANGRTGTHATSTTTPISISIVSPVTPVPKNTPPPDALLIPAVAHADGINAKFQSDVRVSNTSPQVIKYQLTYTPSGATGISTGKQTTFSVDPGRTIALDDILKTWFGTGTANSTGVLEIRPLTQTTTSTSSAAVTGLANLVSFASSRTYNITANGTYGQYVPAIPFANFIGKSGVASANTILSLQQIAQSDRYRTNLGLVEGSGQPASLLVTVFGQNGQQLTSFPVQLAGGQHTQLNSFLAQRGLTVDDGRVEVQVTSSTGKVTAYASVLDNATADPLLVTPVVLNNSGLSKWVVPGVADLANGIANWQTDMRIFNAGTEPVDATLLFYSQAGGEPKTATITLEPGKVRELDKTVSTVFGASNDGGAVHITTPAAARLIATARTYNQTSGGTYGQFISAVTASDAVAVGTRPLQILQVEESDRYRSNIGFAEVSGQPVKLEIGIVPPEGKTSAFIEVDLAPNQFRQLNALLAGAGLTNTHNARITVRAIAGTGRAAAYASVIDRNTQDPTYVPAQ